MSRLIVKGKVMLTCSDMDSNCLSLQVETVNTPL